MFGTRQCQLFEYEPRLKVLDVLDHSILAYPQKGHTHGPLDATFGQCCVKIGNKEFDSADQVVSILQSFLDEAVMESKAIGNKRAYKLDESACWEPWWDELQLQMANLTGPLAPHWFHICTRKDLDLLELGAPETAWPGAPTSHPEDIVCAVKDRMASARVHQVALLVPNSEIAGLQRSLSIQPRGLHPRRAVGEEDLKKVVARAREALNQHLISQEACDFLVGWATGATPKVSRPATYKFLNHRSGNQPTSLVAVPNFLNPAHRQPRQIQILRADGQPLPKGDNEELPLVSVDLE